MARKLSQKQVQQIVANKQKTIEGLDTKSQDLHLGRVVSRYGNYADIEDEAGQIYRCAVRRTVSSLVAGDEVLWGLSGVNYVIEAVKPRRSELLRPDFYDGLKVVAANIDLILIVASLEPQLSTNIIDRYLISCEYESIQPIIIVNKVDLISQSELANLQEHLSFYTQLGYEVFYTSVRTASSIVELRERIRLSNSILVGQSGVGKSSLLNALTDNSQALTQNLSQTSGLGQHTTTCTRLYHIDNGTILDSPGVREFGLWHLPGEKLVSGYREFRPYLGKCRFKDCQHLNEIGCAIRDAVAQGEIAEERYANYVKIRSTIDLQEKRNKTRRANIKQKHNFSIAGKKRYQDQLCDEDETIL